MEIGSVLTGSVLVLNRFYMAVHVVSVRRALVMLYRASAEVIHVEDGQYYNYDFDSWVEICEFVSHEQLASGHDWIRTINFRLQIPRVVRLHQYDKVPRYTLKFNRRNVFARDGHCCQYCGSNYPASKLSFDHVVPRSRGGRTSWENVVCCCLTCNGRKGDRTPEEAGLQLVRKPYRPRQNPMLALKLDNPKYSIWRSFLVNGTAAVDI